MAGVLKQSPELRAKYAQMLALLRSHSLERSFVLSGPAGGGQFGARLGDDGRFLGPLDGDMVTPVQKPRHDAGGTDGDGRNSRQ
ncbi:hypothetical protein [Stenotrophomonas geniculata]|uniref:Uncharacterized protein n=1 Tax=Stenotrophomonas geniculata TaxID=86188 RepID=A0ABW1MVY3_9GAMM|nr:hypothetical protein [Stenotrophomonas maltophilia]